MRPRTLDEFIGQDHIVGHGRLLRRAIEADRLSSLIFHGPPGTGKTTLARIIANTTRANFIALNAVLAGVKDIRKAIDDAQGRQRGAGQPTILFIDEVHRFNKSQQDALLPWVEQGTVIFVGATTENPYFEVNKALVSRSRIFQLGSLTADDLRAVAKQALEDPHRGYGEVAHELDPEALDHLVNVANGDARAVLNALELAMETTPPDEYDVVHITLPVAEESIQQRAVLYDKEGDAHFDIISAFIKSVRGSDPDASLYWLARMVYAGEDPRYIFRRLLILASEDIGMAAPEGISIVNACAQTFDRVGMPEGRYALAHATLYLATAPKSNTTMAFFDALSTVSKEREAEVPSELKDASRDRKSFGHGAGYLYPHAYRDHWVAQQYLPTALQGRVFYDPSGQGYEAPLRDQVVRRREAQLEAMVNTDATLPPSPVLTYGPQDPAFERWLQRTIGGVGARLARQRDALFDAATLQRHHAVLDLNAGAGLLTWEAVRRVPEGGVVACAYRPQDAQGIREQSERLDALQRPWIVEATATQPLPLGLLEGLPDAAPRRFERVVGRNALVSAQDKVEALEQLMALLTRGGGAVLAETSPRDGQRLHALLPEGALEPALREKLVDAEEAIYADSSDPMVNWDEGSMLDCFEHAGFIANIERRRADAQLHVSEGMLARWFEPAQRGHRLSFGDRLRSALSVEELERVREAFRRRLRGERVQWQSHWLLIQARAPKR